ncbi:nuclease SbcCD subunit C, partial [Pyxidicoccus sp. 3LFB2]
AEEAAAEGLVRAAREARAALDTQRSRREAAAEALRKAEEALTRAEGALNEVLARMEAAEAIRRQVLADVAHVFAQDEGWEAKLEENPATFRGNCAKRVALWKTKEEARLNAEKREAEEQKHRARAQGLLDLSVQRAEEDSKLATLKEEDRSEVARARAALLNGRPTEEVRAELRARLDAAVESFERAREAADTAKQAERVATAR